MGIINYFFDSYALIEIFKENPNYKKYISEFVTLTRLNIMEVYHAILRDFDLDKADLFFNTYINNAVEFSDDVMKKAIQFKLKNKKLNLSYVDCIGYIYSLEHGIKFLTGDPQFKNFTGVEFVEK